MHHIVKTTVKLRRVSQIYCHNTHLFFHKRCRSYKWPLSCFRVSMAKGLEHGVITCVVNCKQRSITPIFPATKCCISFFRRQIFKIDDVRSLLQSNLTACNSVHTFRHPSVLITSKMNKKDQSTFFGWMNQWLGSTSVMAVRASVPGLHAQN